MICIKKISLCLAIFIYYSVSISASQEELLEELQEIEYHNQNIERIKQLGLFERKIIQLNFQVKYLKKSLSATQDLACALAMSNGNMAEQIKSHNSEVEISKIKRDKLQKLLDENFNQGL